MLGGFSLLGWSRKRLQQPSPTINQAAPLQVSASKLTPLPSPAPLPQLQTLPPSSVLPQPPTAFNEANDVKILKALALAAVLMAGCKAVNAPLPAGAVDAIDANANEILQPAHAFAQTITAAVQSTDPNVHIELTAAQKGILIALNKSLNVADTLEIAYHANPVAANAGALTSAFQTVQTNLVSAQSTITVSTK